MSRTSRVDKTTFQDWELTASTPNQYSMETAATWLEQMESNRSYTIRDPSWRMHGYGNLVENGICMESPWLKFAIMCSYGDIFLRRISGSKTTFEKVRENISAWCQKKAQPID